MNNTNKWQNNNLQSEIKHPHIDFLFARKDYTIAELLNLFSANF